MTMNKDNECYESFFFLSQSLNVAHIDTVRPFNGKSESSCPDIVCQAAKSSRYSEYHSIEVILLHTYIIKDIP